MPILAVTDASYVEGAVPSARAACIVADGWDAADALAVHVASIPGAADYRPGAFYERELPALLAVLRLVDPPPDLLVVDGYVTLDPEGRPGLGARLADAVGLPVVGIAKTRFAPATHAIEVLRGKSRRPLYVTAASIDAPAAALEVRRMHGEFRIPTLVGLADAAARGATLPIPATRAGRPPTRRTEP